MALGILALGACAGIDSGSDRAAKNVGGLAQAAGDAGSAQAKLLAQARLPDEGREIAYTAELRVKTGDVSAASSRAIEIVEGASGFLFGQDADLEGDERTMFTFKVPPDRYERVLDELGQLGDVQSRTVKADDVTTQVVDLDGRLRTAQTSTERLRGLLTGAGDVAAVVALEGELTKREADVEAVQGRLRTLREQVDLATITLVLDERGVAAVSSDIPGFLAGMRGGWVALVDLLQVSATAVGAVVPFVPLVGLGVLAARHRRRRRAVPSAQPPE